jgi:hypothetical protein
VSSKIRIIVVILKYHPKLVNIRSLRTIFPKVKNFE